MRSFILNQWLPESARYLAANGRTDEALAVLRRVAHDNGKPMLSGRLIVDDLTYSGDAGESMTSSPSTSSDVTLVTSSGRPRGVLQRLLSPELKMTSLLLWFIWLACAFCYYGMVIPPYRDEIKLNLLRYTQLIYRFPYYYGRHYTLP